MVTVGTVGKVMTSIVVWEIKYVFENIVLPGRLVNTCRFSATVRRSRKLGGAIPYKSKSFSLIRTESTPSPAASFSSEVTA